jgi:hypothetical protein
MRHVGGSRSFVSKQVLLFISSRDREEIVEIYV